MIKSKHHNLYMDTAERFAQESYAKRLKVGCVIVKNDNIISASWNGTLPGTDNNCETEDNVTKPEVYHAEESALLKLVCEGGSGVKGSSMFVTHAPCLNCARMIVRSGIKSVYYKNIYRSMDGILHLQKHNIEINFLGE